MANTDDTLNVTTLNVNGLLDYKCQFSLKSFCLQHKIDILFLQETHVSNLNFSQKVDNYFDLYKCFWNFGSNFSRGTAIFISHSIDCNVIKYHRDLDGRFQYVDVLINSIKYRLINIYCPNDSCERKEFLNDIYPFIMCNYNKIFAGDFNCIDKPKIDKKGGNLERGTDGSDLIRNIVTDFELFDVYRFIEPNKVNVTWNSKNVSCRLDRIYLSSTLKNSIKYCRNCVFPYSDHDSVSISFVNNSDVKKGPGYWKFNNSILNDRAFVISFRKYFTELIDGLDICKDVWDFLKDQIKIFCINYCKKKNSVKFKVIKDLEKKYFLLVKEEKSFPGNYLEQIKEIKGQIKFFHLQTFKGSQIRSKVKDLNFSEQPCKYFFEKEVRNGKKKNIVEIRNNNITYTKTDDIVEQFRDFYSKLFCNEDIDTDLMTDFLNDLPCLSDTDRNICDEEITMEEICKSLKGMDNNKSPGPDGLTKEFYCTFFDILKEPLLLMYKDLFNENTLSDTQKLSFITLICKDDNKHFDMKAYRPISLMNIDVKILSKLFCNRICSVIDTIIDLDQTCGIKGRSIIDNAHLLRNIEDYVNLKNLPCCFVSLDQEKAFDRINHLFLFSILEKYNFGPNLIKWIKILYHDLYSSVIINNIISDPIKISRSVKQGCSLSPLLYIMCLEPFARKIRNDKDIVGVKLPGSPDECKISLFADDSTGILCNDNSIKKFLYWIELFGKASGSKLNKEKTKGLWLGAWKYRKDNYRFGIQFVDILKIVGIKFGNVTQDDVWNPVLLKFEKVLNSWKNRRLSLLEKSIIINVIACSKLWYIGSVLHMSDNYINKFQKLVFKFLWNSGVEPLARKTVFLDKKDGGLNIVNIKLKLKAIRLRHLQDIVNKRDAKFIQFSIYWLGFSLRQFNNEFTSLNIPHCDTLTPFYKQCIRDLNLFRECDVIDRFGGLPVKVIYKKLLDKDNYVPIVVRRNPNVDYKLVFKNVFNTFLDRFSRDVTYRLVHNILPVNNLMFNYNIYKSNVCSFCNRCPETFRHLFFDCVFVTPLLTLIKNWILALSNGEIVLDFIHMLFEEIDFVDCRINSVNLLLISLFCKTVWLQRCVKKFEKKFITPQFIYMNFLCQLRLRIIADFNRLERLEFNEHWCFSDLFCKVEDDELTVNFI